MGWKDLQESISESVNDHLRLRNDYLLAENRIMRNQINGRVQLTDSERKELAELGAKLGKKALAEIATVAQPDTILAWHRKFAHPKVDTSEPPKSAGRPRVDGEIEDLVTRMARENRSWGYDRIQGAMNHLGYTISDQTVGNILKRNGIIPAPERKKTLTWREFVHIHLDVLLTTDFFNSDIWNWFRLLVSSLLGFIHYGCHYAHAMGMLLQHQSQGMRSLMLPVCNTRVHVQRWGRWPKPLVRFLAIRCDQGMWGNTISKCIHANEQYPRTRDQGKIVSLSVVRSRQIRDGPMRCRQRLNRLQRDVECQAA